MVLKDYEGARRVNGGGNSTVLSWNLSGATE
jgi:hypothetical protein